MPTQSFKTSQAFFPLTDIPNLLEAERSCVWYVLRPPMVYSVAYLDLGSIRDRVCEAYLSHVSEAGDLHLVCAELKCVSLNFRPRYRATGYPRWSKALFRHATKQRLASIDTA